MLVLNAAACLENGVQGSAGGGSSKQPAGNESAGLSSSDDGSEAYNSTSFNGGAEGDEARAPCAHAT